MSTDCERNAVEQTTLLTVALCLSTFGTGISWAGAELAMPAKQGAYSGW